MTNRGTGQGSQWVPGRLRNTQELSLVGCLEAAGSCGGGVLKTLKGKRTGEGLKEGTFYGNFPGGTFARESQGGSVFGKFYNRGFSDTRCIEGWEKFNLIFGELFHS